MPDQLNHNNQFTAKDIERYYAGQMSAAEMHALEKAALDDPFLEDALEGYSHSINPQQEINELKQAIDKRTRKASVIAFSKRDHSGWWKVAALALLLAGTGWLTYRIILPPANEMATTEKVEVQKKDSSAFTLQAPEVQPEEWAASSDDTTLSSSNLAPQKHYTAKRKLFKQERASNDTSSSEKDALHQNQISDITAGLEELPFTNIAQSLVKDRKDTTTPIHFDGYISKRKAESSPEKQAEELLQAVSEQTDEIVLSRKKRDTSINYLPKIIMEEVEPAEEGEEFDDYIAGNLKLPENFDIKSSKGEIKLSFDVDKFGNPVNIKVVKSLCDKCDEEAIRLLKQGPKLIKKHKHKKGKVSIKFK